MNLYFQNSTTNIEIYYKTTYLERQLVLKNDFAKLKLQNAEDHYKVNKTITYNLLFSTFFY